MRASGVSLLLLLLPLVLATSSSAGDPISTVNGLVARIIGASFVQQFEFQV